MAERKLNFNAPLLSTRKMNKEAVSVRRNMARKLTHDDDDSKSKTSDESPVLVQDIMRLDQVPESASCLLEKAIDEEEDDDDDVFSDALDTLSLKQSISGNNVEATKPPSEDSQPRDFMLDRFLPAAKSMAVEQQQQQQQQPQYALKRQPVRQIRDIVPLQNRYHEYNSTPSYYDEESDEDEDEDEEYLSRRGGCGMSPQLCFKNSLGMLSSPQVKSSKVSLLKSRFLSVKKLALDSIYKQKLGSSRAQSPVHPSVGNKFTFGSEQLSTASMPSSPYRQIGSMSPYRSVGNSSPIHPAGFPGTRKEAEIMRAQRLNKHVRNTSKSHQDLLLYPKSTRLDSSTSSLVETTLRVDTQNCSKTSNDQSNSNVKILPENVGKKPKAILEFQALERIKKMKADELEKNNNSGCDLPTPKKPSDSWLLRNLPSVTSKIPSRRYLLHPQEKDLEENSTSVTKWETIVKTSCIHRDHIRFSEELVARSSCQSNV